MTNSESKNCGVIYVAAGEQFVEEARLSAQSLNEACPDIHTTLFTDQASSPPEFDSTQNISDPNYGFADKIENMLRSPYERTIYLDCDTYVCCSEGLYDIFNILERFDVAAAHDTDRTANADNSLKQAYNEGIPEAFPMFQGGVVAYRSSVQVRDWMRTWLRRYRDHLSIDQSATDQESLRSTLYQSNLRIATLPPEYNFRIPYPQLVSSTVKILHGRATNFNEIESILNKDLGSGEYMRRYEPAHVGVPRLTEDYQYVKPLINPGELKVAANKLNLSLQQRGILRTLLYLCLGGINTGYMRAKTISKSLREEGIIKTCEKIIQWTRTKKFE